MSKSAMLKVNPQQQAGFSLLEILVAFAILAISLTVILNIFSTGVRAAYLAEEYTIAVQIAESVLAEKANVSDLTLLNETGDHGDKFQWQVDVQAIDPGIEDFDSEDSRWQMYQIIVRVQWLAGETEREVKLQTLRLAAKEQ